MTRQYEKLVRGHGEPHDVQLIVDMADNINGKSFCLLADSCLGSVLSSLKHFKHEYEYLATNRKPMYSGYEGRWRDE